MRTNIKPTLFIAAALAGMVFLFTNCSSEDEFEGESKSAVEINLSGEFSPACQGCLIIDETNPSNMYSRVDSISQYGYGTAFTLPDSLKDCSLKIMLSGKMRETEATTGYIAIALHGKDTIYFWGSIFSSKHVTELNKWTAFKDSAYIDRSVNKPSSQHLKIFSFKQVGKGYYDVDDLVVKITRQ